MKAFNFPNGVNVAPFNIPILMPMAKGGKAFFVDPVNGNDGRNGLTIDDAVQTVTRAYALCTSGKGDVVFLFNNGLATGTARLTDETTGITWAKNNTHLVGICAPVGISQRARISHSATAGVGMPTLFKLDAAGCMFQNFQLFQGYSTDEDQICLELTSNAQRNYFSNVHIAGMGHATPAARTGSTSLKLGGAENVFDGCVIGVDTATRNAANSEMLITVGTRNVFRGCTFLSFVGGSGAGHLFASAAASCLDRWILFERCLFINPIESTSTAMTAALSINGTGSPAGFALVRDCALIGATYWVAADTAKVKIQSTPSGTNSQTMGMMLSADLP